MLWLAYLCLAFIPSVQMVKHEDFKTCEQSSFCRRNRALAQRAEESSYVSPYDLHNVTLEAGILRGTITKQSIDATFPLQITLLKSGAARVTIDEQRRRDLNIVLPDGKENLINKARFNEAEKYTIVGGLDVDQTATMKAANGVTSIKFGMNELQITHKSMKIVCLRNGHIEAIINDRGLLNIEHWRAKPATDTPDDMTGKEDQPADPEDPEGMFEESFAGKIDTKPRGPEAVAIDITLPGYDDVYGIPEHASDLSLKETTGPNAKYSDPYRLYNADVFQYEHDSPMALYGAIPFMQAHKAGSDVGIFWLNGAETWIDIRKPVNNPLSFAKTKTTQTHWVSEAGLLDVFIFMKADLPSLYKSYSDLIGNAMLPPLFSIAHHQCRWNYESEDDVLDVTANFDKFDIPYDVIWLDIEYTVGKRYFTWNKAFFPDPARMMRRLEETKRKLVAIIDPHLKADNDYPIYKEALANSHYIKDSSGNPYEGQCWPGPSIWPDYTQKKTCDWWASLYDVSKFEGSLDNLHVWNDMNEPAVFTGPDITMHRDSIHANGWEHRDLHNIYGSLMVKTSYEGLKARNKEEPKRPFILSRSFWPGVHRVGAIWSGDNMGTWEHLESATATLISNGLAGMTFSGADVGGFFDDPPKDMLTRWYQAGAFYPFFRAHAHIDTKRREPWLIGEPYTGMIRAAIILRYTLLPTWYTAFYETSVTGIPIMRPHFLVFPNDEAGFKIQNQYFIGNSGLLHHPVVTKDAESIELYLADDQPYYDYHDYTVYKGRGHKTIKTPLDCNPVFIHGGHIIARRDRQRRSSELMRKDPITLVIALDNTSFATGTLYLDDGETFRNENGEYLYRRFEFKDNILKSDAIHSSREFDATITGVHIERIIILGASYTKGTIHESGETRQASVEIDSRSITIRNPKCLLSADWSIKLS